MTPGMRLEVGRVLKAHGLAGEVVVAPVSNRPQRFAAGSVLYVGDDAYTIDRARPHQHRYLVQFAGVADRAAADQLRGAVLTADAPEVSATDELWVHEVIGCRVVDRAQREVGLVVAVEANPAHDLLVLDSGVLIPTVFVVSRTPGAPGVVVVDLPEGLLELFERG